ncbi:MAG: cysteine peptidase family C39 domain-containing protein [bacterium]|nr:cysteine peptidase family C39 domain-containing protein [bacterium]
MRFLDVPYVPQSGALCGGAALAMVLRYWGKTGVLAEDFAALAEPGQAGLLTATLVKAVEDEGWTALPLAGNRAGIAEQLARGRPIIALLRAGADSYHYVVLVAWTDGWVVVHDPVVGPFRALREAEFATAWSGSGDWALLILPPQQSGEQTAPEVPAAALPAHIAPAGCDSLMAAGVLLAREGDAAGAEHEFLAAQALCPGSAAPLRERAGLRFRADDWPVASRLAQRALALDAGDAHARRLLAGSRFLLGDVEGALRAWNHLSEPRTDLARIDGLARTRYAVVAVQLDLPPGRMLTPEAYRRASRRLEELPAQADFRLSLKPLPAGITQPNVTVLERPLAFGGRWDVASAGLDAVLGHGVDVGVASPMGQGELWSVGWDWWRERPRVSLALTVPAVGGRPGIWRVEGFWERQAYAPALVPAAFVSSVSGAVRSVSVREERRRTGLSFADWVGPDLRLEIGAALDEWDDRGAHASLAMSVGTRWAGDRLALTAALARWASLGSGAPFGNGSLSLGWDARGSQASAAWRGSLGVSRATAGAPLALWSGAGTGYGRAPLLRAHPLLDGGVVRGPVFGRALAQATIERQAWLWRPGPVQFGWAVFVDMAKPWETGPVGRVPWQVDGGAGLRVKVPGRRGQLRVDAARGFTDGNSAVSAGWLYP